ncbi:MAG: prepilin peptidase [Clostridiales bacterium]|nr:prepilin peptidase [Candidatus Blautia equi]
MLTGLLLVTSGTAMLMDLRTMKVDNGWLLFMLVPGFLTRLLTEGISSVPDFLMGMLLPFFLLIGLFYFHMLGAGDIKLLCVLGGMTGVRGAGILMLCTLFLGGIFAFFFLLFYGGVRERFRYFFSYVRDCVQNGEVRPYYQQGPRLENFHFTVPIFLGTLLYAGGLF